MLSLLQSAVFLNPWLLLALGLLPALWFLLKVLPPTPSHIRFPAIRLLFGLESDEKAPVSTPWPLILLRLILVMLVILGVAHPVLNPGTALTEDGPLLIVVDNDWASATDWPQRIAVLQNTLSEAERDGITVRLITTTPEGTSSGSEPGLPERGTLRASEASEILESLMPQPWENDRLAAAKLVDKAFTEQLGQANQGTPNIIYASNGLGGSEFDLLLASLSKAGPVTLLLPGLSPDAARDADNKIGENAVIRTEVRTEVRSGPLIIEPKDTDFAQMSFSVRRADTQNAEAIAFIARNDSGRALARAEALFETGEKEATLSFSLPTELQNQATSVAPEQARGAGAVAVLDARWRRRPVGLIDEASMDIGPALLSESYFVRSALEPISQLSQGPVSSLLSSAQSVIVAPDSVAIEPTEMDALVDWVEQGGVLLRFAGPRLAANQANKEINDPLIPVRLRAGGRVLGGAMVWSEPLAINAFNPEGPLKDLSTTTDTRVARQVLAEPAPDLDSKTWARLSDGTPIVTADRRGEGWVILVHTTANTDWSTLSLSGLFVDLLERIVDMSRGVIGLEGDDIFLVPERVLDGFGALAAPGPFAKALTGTMLESAVVGPEAPPGLYAQGRLKRALNLGPSLSDMSWVSDNTSLLPKSVTVQPYSIGGAIDLRGIALALALIFLLVDILVSLWLRGYLYKSRLQHLISLGQSRSTVATLFCVLLLGYGVGLGSSKATAQILEGKDAEILTALSGTTFAYVVTGDAQTDEISHAGLQGLSMTLRDRTAVEAVEPIGVDLRRDQIHFFPLLYWPITDTQPPLNALAIERLNDFMATGGTILFDTRSQAFGGVDPATSQTLRRLSRGLEIPTLTPVPPEHVLTKSFYLMQDFPGRWAGGDLWVEAEGSAANDGVSRVIVGGADWASAWAIDQFGDPIFPVSPGGERQREMAYRFGVNLVMYILTGNYKADQVHIPSILERLGQ